jgi:pyridoxal biosynthesis lyase PdxS
LVTYESIDNIAIITLNRADKLNALDVDLGEALRRIGEGAAMIRTKGEAGSGNIVEAVRHLRCVMGEIRARAAGRVDMKKASNQVRTRLQGSKSG